MVKFLALAAVAASAVAQTKIVNGTEASLGKYLYVTGLRQNETSAAKSGASLVGSKILFATAHCAATEWATFASIGSHFKAGGKDGERIKIVKRTQHPKYSKAEPYDNNFANFELEKASTIAPVEIQ